MLVLFYCFYLSMKLKQLPSDFIVEEITTVPISSEKLPHTVYQMEKQEPDTFEAIRLLAKKIRISHHEIGYAGLKDKHSKSMQYISIPTQYNVQSLSLENLTVHPVGFSQKKIQIGDLEGNRFTIVVRDIKESELDAILARARLLPMDGVPNYFDSQRFGSVIHDVFIAKLLVQKQYEPAVKQFLTAYQKSESRSIKNEKRRILVHWNNLESLYIINKTFAEIIKEYRATHDWGAAYKKIPSYLREIHVNAYQSYLWNECIKQLLKHIVEKKKLYTVEYAAGSLLFYSTLIDSEKRKIPETFRTISETAFFTEDERSIIHTVLQREGITLDDFAIEKNTGNFFKSRPRTILIVSDAFTLSEPDNDEMNNTTKSTRYKLQVSFTLPKGSYATIITKRLFGH